MVKIVDNYVLERRIGKGQFGEVFKGYNKITGQDIAVKCVRRKSLTGKFTELLENEIKVLRWCNNANIVKLYDIKKTSNNFYLILEYCNEGDLSEYIKAKKLLTEDEGVEFLLQIFNAFKDLVKAKIMHRDFKLANILKHNGNIKIADFGFSKLLGQADWAQTMLGSPLNMAPEVLQGKQYDNKADIWSVGTVFYEMLFARPPFVAKNIVDLIKNINNKKLKFPRHINNISKTCEDVLRKMLTVDPRKRISWQELFKHQINHYMEDKVMDDLGMTLKEDDLNMSISKFYISQNKVIQHPVDIERKKDINEYTLRLAKGQNKGEDFNGQIVKRQTKRPQKKKQKEEEEEVKTEDQVKQSVVDDNEMPDKETEREILIKMIKKNTNRILHERNKYVFLASVAEDVICNDFIYSEIVAFLLVKKLFRLLCQLTNCLKAQKNIFGLPKWQESVKTSDFEQIKVYIIREYEVFNVYLKSMHSKIIKAPKYVKIYKKKKEIDNVVNLNINQDITKITQQLILEYSEDLIHYCKKMSKLGTENILAKWIHADQILDSLNLDRVFQYESKDGRQFNFKLYYEEVKSMQLQDIMKKVLKKFGAITGGY